MRALLDTNILVHAANAASPVHTHAKRLRDEALLGAIQACLTPQVLWEFYAVITTPRRVSRPLSCETALKEVQAYVQADRLSLIYPRHSTVLLTIKLLSQHPTTAQGLFDVVLVATMLDHGLVRLYTENVDDFKAFREIEVINPFASAVA